MAEYCEYTDEKLLWKSKSIDRDLVRAINSYFILSVLNMSWEWR